MEFISEKEFLKQPKEIQETLLDWWKPQLGDLINTSLGIKFCLDLFSSKIRDNNSNIWTKRTIRPLFTETQLRKFIEDKFNGHVKVELEWSNDGYIINVVSEINDEKVYEEYYSLESEPIKAYWYAVLQIAKEEV